MISSKVRNKTIELNDYSSNPQTFLREMEQKHEIKSRTPYTALKELLEEYGADRSKRRLKRNLEFSAKLLRKDSTNVGTLQNRFTELKRLYLDIYEGAQEDMINGILSLDAGEVKEKITKQKEALRANLANKVDIGKDEIKAAVKTLKDSDDWHDKILLIILSSGRRLIEVLRNESAPQQIKENLAWMNLAKGAREIVYAPLLFIDYLDFHEAFGKIKMNRPPPHLMESLTNSELTNKYNSKLNDRVKQILPGLQGTHGLRALYGKVATETKKPRTMDSVLYLNQILGHQSHNLETALYYKKYNLEEKTPERKEPPPNKTVLRLVKAMEELERDEPGYSIRRLISYGKFSYHSIKKYKEQAEKIIEEKKKKN